MEDTANNPFLVFDKDEVVKKHDSNVATKQTLNPILQQYSGVMQQWKMLGDDNSAGHAEGYHINTSHTLVLFGEENVAPCPDLPRAETFLPADTVARINPSAAALLDAEVGSLKTLGKEFMARGLSGLCSLLAKGYQLNDKEEDNAIEEVQLLLKKIEIDDDDTGYIARCLMDVDTWVRVYGGYWTMFIYRENHSDADHEEKMSRSNCIRSGKACDFIFLNRNREGGVGENTGPKYHDHHDKAKTNFVDIIKVARAQHIRFQTELVQQTGFNPLPPILRKALNEIPVSFFQIIGMRIRFYMLLKVNGDIFAFWEWASEDLPESDTDVEVVQLCKAFITHRGDYLMGLLERPNVLENQFKRGFFANCKAGSHTYAKGDYNLLHLFEELSTRLNQYVNFSKMSLGEAYTFYFHKLHAQQKEPLISGSVGNNNPLHENNISFILVQIRDIAQKQSQIPAILTCNFDIIAFPSRSARNRVHLPIIENILNTLKRD
ncbi:hypothetical protein G9A89_013066 [Geosiphon pyriformis]|nr:hypothetical protein G9A89_013066 [Geosiphon pyriformis]